MRAPCRVDSGQNRAGSDQKDEDSAAAIRYHLLRFLRTYREATTGFVSVPIPSYMQVPVSPPL